MKSPTSHNMVRVKWLEEGDAVDANGTAWVKTWSFEDLPELVYIEPNVGASGVKNYLEGRFGYRLKSWSYWSAAREAASLANLSYSSDPM